MSEVSDDKEDDTDADDKQVDLVSILGLLLYSCYQLPDLPVCNHDNGMSQENNLNTIIINSSLPSSILHNHLQFFTS